MGSTWCRCLERRLSINCERTASRRYPCRRCMWKPAICTTSKYMCDVKWAPLVGATIVARNVWEKIPADQRDQMLAAARKSGEALKKDIRDQGERAIVTMMNGKPGQRANKPTVTHLNEAALAEWRKQTEAIYPKMKGKMVPPDLFDDAQRLRDEFRAQHRDIAVPKAEPKAGAGENHTNQGKRR